MKKLGKPSSLVIAAAVIIGLCGATSPALAVPSAQVMKDYKSTYSTPAGRKLISMNYVGKPRHFTKVIGLVPVAFTGYQVEIVHEFECGTKVKYTFEVWYRNDKVYDSIASLDIETLSTPPAPAGLDESTVAEQLKASWPKDSVIQSVKVKSQKGGWTFCDQKWELDNLVTITAGDAGQAMHTKYECHMINEIMKKDGVLSITTNNCVNLAGKRMGGSGCDYATQCKNLGQVSTVPSVEWKADLQEAMKTKICEAYEGAAASDCKIESLTKLSEGAQEIKFDNPAKRFTVQFEPSFNERIPGGGGREVRSRYRCKAEIEMMLRYVDTWSYTSNSISICPPKGGCEEPWNAQNQVHRICTCLEPKELCSGR